jgi:hypothetical protein
MHEHDELVAALTEATQGQEVWPAANEKTIAAIEQRFGIELPLDMATFYRTMNGMPWPTKPEHGWVRIWALDSWRRVHDEPGLQDPKYSALAEAIIVADHCDESWWYAAQFRENNAVVEFFAVDGLRLPKRVAGSFAAFVRAAVADSPDIYPYELSAG